MKRNLIKAIAQVIYGFYFSWGVLAVFGIKQPLKITIILSAAFIPGWWLFNWLVALVERHIWWPRKRGG